MCFVEESSKHYSHTHMYKGVVQHKSVVTTHLKSNRRQSFECWSSELQLSTEKREVIDVLNAKPLVPILAFFFF